MLKVSLLPNAQCQFNSEAEAEAKAWIELFQKPSDWWDNRAKPHVRNDFRHHKTDQVLQVSSPNCPVWVRRDLRLLRAPICGERARYSIDADILEEVKQCRDANLGRRLLSRARERELLSDVTVATKFMHMFVRCDGTEDARGVFDNMAVLDLVACNVMIKGYVTAGRPEVAFELYETVCAGNCLVPSETTYLAALSACVSVADQKPGRSSEWLEKGKTIHSRIMMDNCSDIFLDSTLVHMYARFGKMEHARQVFDRMRKPDALSWTVLIQGYVDAAQPDLALEVFDFMAGEGACFPDAHTFVAALSACADLSNRKGLEKGKSIHSWAFMSGCKDIYVDSSLVNMYAKLYKMVHAQAVFDMAQQNEVLWSSLVQGYADNNMALEVFDTMAEAEDSGFLTNELPFIAAASACADLAGASNSSKWLEKGKTVHSWAVMSGCNKANLESSLIHMYARFGKMEFAQVVFDGMAEPDLVTWNAIIWGFVDSGDYRLALHYSAVMDSCGVQHDFITFQAVLKACENLMVFEKGHAYHAEIQHAGLEQEPHVAISLVNFYANCGCLDLAEQVFDSLVKKTTQAWNALLNGYGLQGHTERLFEAFAAMREQEVAPDSITFVCLLNACSHVGLVQKGKEIFGAMYTQFGMVPALEHYTCLVDLLARSNLLEEAVTVIRSMPHKADKVIWSALLAGCAKWKNVTVGETAYQNLIQLDETRDSAYVMMANIYVSLEEQDKKIP